LRHQLITWLVQLPLLFYAAHGSFSLFSLNGAMAVGGSTAVDTYTEGGPTRLILFALHSKPLHNRSCRVRRGIGIVVAGADGYRTKGRVPDRDYVFRTVPDRTLPAKTAHAGFHDCVLHFDGY
jgi:hypothetical protein